MKPVRCVRCHRILKDPTSVAIGMGPECRGALSGKGWKFPRARWKVRGGRTEFIGISGKVEPPLGDLSQETHRIMRQLEERKVRHEKRQDDEDQSN